MATTFDTDTEIGTDGIGSEFDFSTGADGPVTLQVVARQAGVSPSTVSRILNGTAKVSEAKRASVERAIESLGFRPNLVARSLAGGRTMTVGVLTQYIDSPFYGAGVRGIEEILTGRGFTPIVTSGLWDEDRERRSLWDFVERKVDGLIVLTSRLSDDELKAFAEKLPLVVTGRDLGPAEVQSIDFDNRLAGRVAAEHLVNLGHREIAVITGMRDHKDSDERLEGILTEVESAGLSIDRRLVVVGDYHERGGHRAMRSVIAAGVPFSAVIALNDQMALGAMLALRQSGLRVPEDVSVVGMDDLPAAAFYAPPLTTVAQPVYQMGKTAAELLLRRLAGELVGPQPAQIVEPYLAVRESTKRVT